MSPPKDNFFSTLHPKKIESHYKKEKARARELKRTPWWRQKKQEGLCHYCEDRFPPEEITMDHKIPLAQGGKSTKGNLVPACGPCNYEKQNKSTVDMAFEEIN